MKAQITDRTVKLWLSANDTYDWAYGSGACWPGSFLSGKRLFVEFDSGGLVDIAINGGRGDQDCPADEFNAITSEVLRYRVPKSHPAYLASVGQFVNDGGCIPE